MAKEEPKGRGMLGKSLLPLAIAFIAIPALFLILQNEDQRLGVKLLVYGVVLGFALYYAHSVQCPACGKYWAAQYLRKQFIKPKPKPSASAFTRALYKLGNTKEKTTYKCKHCGHTWNRTTAAD